VRALLAVSEQGRNNSLRSGCRTGSSTFPPQMTIFARALAVVSILLFAAWASAQLEPKIVLTSQNWGCPLVDLNGGSLVQTQPGPFSIYCVYTDVSCPYSTDFGGGSTISGCPATGYLKCPGCQPRPLVGSFPLVCPVVGPGQALLTQGHLGRDSSIICKYGPSIKCSYTKDGNLIPTSQANCPTTANHIPAAACPTASRPRPSCKP